MRIRFLLSVVAALLVMMLGLELYRVVAYREERRDFVEMRARLTSTGAAVVEGKMASDAIRAQTEARDVQLKMERAALQRYFRHARHGALPAHLYGEYRAAYDLYHDHVNERNCIYMKWQSVAAQTNAALKRYYALGDSLRAAATAMGEPYYAVPSPLQAAAERKGMRVANP